MSPAPHITASPRIPDNPPIRPARFVHGSIMRHVITMAGTGAIGLMAVFAVDLLNFFYISKLHNPALTGAIAFATSISYVQISVAIGLTIGLGACIGRLIGARQHDEARRMASAFLAVMVALALVLGLTTAIFAPNFLRMLRADGNALDQATLFLRITAPAFPLACLGMGLSALLRSVGDARRSMRMTLTGAAVSACLDPILIFGFHLGLEGAAISTILSRAAITASGFLNLRGHDMLEWPDIKAIRPAVQKIGGIALPAIATNLATPTGALFVTHAMAAFGLNAVSGQATIDRIVPVAFALVFALTGSVGPIMAQNLGAQHYDRVKETLMAALKLTALCVMLTWLALALGQNIILDIFTVNGVGVDIVKWFCQWLVSSYMFIGLLFVANTAFNNLGHPFYSTGFNWGRATLGTIPFVWIGAHYFGPIGILFGQSLGAVIFGTAAILTAFRVIHKLGPTH
ncbi:Na+ driven multidrug/antimicrobial extrusion protein MatE [Neokomagataea thailandica NBRC 106555]|uniref:Multidrug transporter n=2 Tax=Neokomagataea TaxID=1223423 RepID=A0A4Y6V8H2_9PROT|nr:multidrug transporter [Neokomagataea tanensis]GBR53897.1 Na+ driven multidrug/antimicrobial extrusion protein MatE [Neokomagataea thailandica NBRC 106555]